MMDAESVAKFGIADYAVFGFMLCVSAGIGVYSACSGRKRKTTQELLLGDRNMSIFPVAMSVLASFLSAITLLGVPAEVYQNGIMFIIVCFGFALMIPVSAHLYVPVFYNLGVTSAYEYLELRFNRAVRSVASTIFSVNMLIFMAIVLYAPSLALSQVTGINLWFAVLSTGLVCTFYTSIGGIKAVVWTDLFQIILMFGSMIAIIAKGAVDVGGINELWEINVKGGRTEFFNFETGLTTRHTFWGLVIGSYFMWVTTYGCNQAMIQRYMSLPSLKAAQITIWINMPGFISLTSISCFAGLVIYAKYYNCDPLSAKRIGAPDQLLPLFVMETMGNFPGVPGLFVSGVFSGALSTVSSGVNSLAAITLEDLIKAYIKPDLSDNWSSKLTKILACSYGVVSILLVIVAQQMGNVLSAAISTIGMLGGPMLSLFTMGMFFPWINSAGALVGVFTGLITALWAGIGAFVYRPPINNLPVTTSGCANIYVNISESAANLTNNSTEAPLEEDDVFALYKMSYLWLSVIGCVISVIVGLIVSFLTGCRKSEAIDPNLLSPPIRKIISICSPSVRKQFLLPNFNTEREEKQKTTNGIVNNAFSNSLEMTKSEQCKDIKIVA